MQHITPERIAALADEPATLHERAHLVDCAACNAELAAAQRLVRMALTETPAIERPITSWDRLQPALKADGLINTHESEIAVLSQPGGGSGRYRWWMQAAAAAFLTLGGAVVGRASADWPIGSASGTDVVATGDTVFQSTAEAMRVVDRAFGDYQRAIAYIAANDSNVTMRGRDAAEVYQARLEVLEQAAARTRAALFRAPQDPVLNNYYLSTMGARDLTLRQLGGVVPVSSAGRTRF
jgi:hypothetical protein